MGSRQKALFATAMAVLLLAPASAARADGLRIVLQFAESMMGMDFETSSEDIRKRKADKRKESKKTRQSAGTDTTVPPGTKTDRPASVPAPTLPTPLSTADAARYLRIFALQDEAKWTEADKLIGEIENKILMGYVLRQRYLNPCCYRSKYKELKAWMASYGDHPGAEDIYKLARKRKPRKAAAPRSPWGVVSPQRFWSPWTPEVLPRPRLSRRQAREARAIVRRFDRYVKRDYLKNARKWIGRKRAERLLGAARIDQMRTLIAKRYLQLGKFETAYDVADPAAKRSGRYVQEARWIAGLAAWALKKYGPAADHFVHVATARGENDWFVSGGAYWAARAYAADGKPDSAKQWLERAATFSRTFYGVLARHKLGLKHDFAWTVPAGDTDHIARIARAKQGERAFALIQIGRLPEAGEELMRQYFRNREIMGETYLAVAHHARLPGLAYGLSARLLARGGDKHDGGLYPIPAWTPKGGFVLDRPMVYAIMRQESAFRANATSPAGARGLMQLMPATASWMAKDRSLRRKNVDKLYEPLFNIHLGQSFFALLLRQPAISNNLFFAISAYNAGEGNLAKWEVRSDPLLFIEAIHLRETRLYVERVMYNLWAYRIRMGQKPVSLEALAKDQWPRYVAQEAK